MPRANKLVEPQRPTFPLYFINLHKSDTDILDSSACGARVAVSVCLSVCLCVVRHKISFALYIYSQNVYKIANYQIEFHLKTDTIKEGKQFIFINMR